MKRNFILLSLALGLSAGQAAAQTPSSDWFTQVTAQVGFPDTIRATTVAVTDINNDDYPDLVVVHVPVGSNVFNVRHPIKTFLNVEDNNPANPTGRKFIDVTANSGINIVLPDSANQANCFTLADFNNDGNIDIVTAIYYHRIENYPYPNDRFQVYLGDGTGNFTWLPNNGLSELGLVNARGLTVLDYDKDGNLDIFIPAWFKDYSRNVMDHGYLFKGRGDGTFEDVTVPSGIVNHVEAMYSASSMDFNDDCYPDIFTAPYCRTGGKVLKNNGDGTFSNVADAVGYNLFKMGAGQNACTFTTTPEDVNNDGYMDLFVAEVHGGNNPGQFRSTIAMNKGPSQNYSFEINPNLLPPTASSHRGDYDGGFLDFENDGLKDLILAQGGYMPATDRTYFFQQQADNSFKDITQALGLLVPNLRNSANIEPFDIDLDGDDDIFICDAKDGYSHILQNNIGHKNNWIAVKLNPVSSGINKSAIGARITVYYEGKMQMREINAGRGMYAGQQPFILNFGLNKAAKVDSVVVRWPDAACTHTKVENPPINKMLTVSDAPSSIQELGGHETKVFPNPTSGYLVIQKAGIVSEIVSLAVTDISGRIIPVVYQKSDSDKLVLNMAKLPAGVYTITVNLNDKKTLTKKVVKE